MVCTFLCNVGESGIDEREALAVNDVLSKKSLCSLFLSAKK